MLVQHGATDRSVELLILNPDGTKNNAVVYNSAGIDLWYRRDGGAKVSITVASLSALTDAHADGGFLLIGDGVYRLDLPDAAFASGARKVTWGGAVTGGIIEGGMDQLVPWNPDNADGLGLSRLDATVGSRASQTSVDDLPTNAELNTALGAADDAVLAAIAALNNLSNAQLTAAIAAGDDATLAAIAALPTAATVASIASNVSLVLAALQRSEAWTGTLSAIAAGATTLPGGHGIADDAVIYVKLLSGTDAAQRARFHTYSGSGNVWTPDPAWDSDGEPVPSGPITAVAYAFPKTSAADLAALADAVWDEALAGHATAGSAGAGLAAASSAGDPWATPLPGAYGAGTAGFLIGTYVDALISSRLAAAGYTTPPSASAVAAAVRADQTTELGRIDEAISSRAATGAAMTLTSGERTAIANEVEAQIINDTDSEKVLEAIVNKIAEVNPSLDDLTLGGIAAAVRTELAVELARIDAAVSSRLAAAGYTAPPSAAANAAAVRTELGTELGRLDVGVGTRAAPADVPTALQNADALLARHQKGGSNTAPTVAQALASGLFLITIDAGVMTVRHGDGTTAFTRTLTRAQLNAIIGSAA